MAQQHANGFTWASDGEGVELPASRSVGVEIGILTSAYRDVGYVDEDECLYIVDRIKELIKYKAYQVAPAELEAKLLHHPSVADAAVIGVPDEEAGELPKAYVVRSDQNLLAEDLHSYLREHVGPQKRLRGGIEFVSEIPKSASGKILR
ncbi:PREDICTED: 4-coumarate--CoA ligase-like 7 [Priapulus caudatus]|uniref:4-coumarate--CoA ligase-like 7 n=1 Tax=Priapulus caudatus TaxID=37621 RepID=A0ABM1E7S6_PRICU|nr:PREDICTED: 4-coumarate--CoA ligase-like 7 [Priapulus caudatus]